MATFTSCCCWKYMYIYRLHDKHIANSYPLALVICYIYYSSFFFTIIIIIVQFRKEFLFEEFSGYFHSSHSQNGLFFISNILSLLFIYLLLFFFITSGALCGTLDTAMHGHNYLKYYSSLTFLLSDCPQQINVGTAHIEFEPVSARCTLIKANGNG